jgi:hypothetical protein
MCPLAGTTRRRNEIFTGAMLVQEAIVATPTPVRLMVTRGSPGVGGRLNGFFEAMLIAFIGVLMEMGLRVLLSRLVPAVAR